MWNSIVRRFTLDDEFSCLLLNLSISRISISGKFSYILYILTQLEWSWPSVTKTVLRATSFPWKPSSSTTRPPSTMGTRLSQDAIRNNTVQCYRESQAHLKWPFNDWLNWSGEFHFTPNRNFRKLLLNVIIFNITNQFLCIWKKRIKLM